jgi:DNA-binding beta-propeller fold protein YncE
MKKISIRVSLCAALIIAGSNIGNANSITCHGDALYMADMYKHVIFEIDKRSGVASIIAGSAGQAGFADGPGETARFRYPSGVTSDGEKLYVTDTINQTIRVVSGKTGAVSTLAGLAGKSGSADGIGSAARFNNPKGILYDGGNLYIADTDNHTVRKIVIETGYVTTIAGKAGLSGSADGKVTSARFNCPSDIAIEGANLYITDSNNNTIRKIDRKTGKVSTLAGTAGSHGAADGIGAFAGFSHPRGIVIHGKNIYVVDSGTYTIRKIEISSKKVTTFAGSTWASGSTDGKKSVARFLNSEGITCDAENLYVTQTESGTIRKIGIATGTVTSLPEIKW